jgi:hypothetical protein
VRRLALLSCLALWACPATPGVTCLKHDDCKSLKDGYCAKAEICTRECTGPGTCDEGSACFDAGRRQVCLPTCVDDAGCPARFGCHPAGEAMACQLDNPFEPATR